jgi:arabinogalactan oligomer/maltooligosaccharide transport system substrate-binding protein
MKASQKKIISVILIGVLLTAMAVIINRNDGVYDSTETEAVYETKLNVSEAQAYQEAPTDLLFWYEDDSYQDFFEEAAIRYYEKTGTKVAVECQDSIDYIGDIYDKTMQDAEFPDVYLIQGDNLASACLYGLVAVNEKGVSEETASHAAEASHYNGTLYGYPLSYNTCVFVYQNGFFETAPESLQSIITYSNENDPSEDVLYLLEWDVNDPFYDFPFVGNSVTFTNETAAEVQVNYDENLYQQDLEYFEEILESFSVNASTVSESSIVSNFLAGRTLCAIIDTDSLAELDGYEYALMQIPDLNENLKSVTCASTDMLVVNDFSAKADAAADFAEFATVTMAEELHSMTGHYSVIPSTAWNKGGNQTWTESVAFEAYESAVLMPDARDAKDFWVNLEETILKYF